MPHRIYSSQPTTHYSTEQRYKAKPHSNHAITTRPQTRRHIAILALHRLHRHNRTRNPPHPPIHHLHNPSRHLWFRSLPLSFLYRYQLARTHKLDLRCCGRLILCCNLHIALFPHRKAIGLDILGSGALRVIRSFIRDIWNCVLGCCGRCG